MPFAFLTRYLISNGLALMWGYFGNGKSPKVICAQRKVARINNVP